MVVPVADHLFVDPDGIPTLVEVKRSSDTRIRREVVGQMLDYAANGTEYWPVQDLRAQFEAHCEQQQRDPAAVLADFAGPDRTPDRFWQQVETNLRAGNIRLVFVADEIPPELRRIVEFLNEQMNPAEVLAIEVKQYLGENDLRTLVPTVVGQQKKGGKAGARQWDESRFLEELEARCGAAAATTARQLLTWAQTSRLYVWYGEGRRSGSFTPVLEHGDLWQQLFAVYTYGSVEIYFQWYKAPFDTEPKRLELLERLNALPGVSIPRDAIRDRRPSIALSVLGEHQAVKPFCAVFDWYIQEVRGGVSTR